MTAPRNQVAVIETDAVVATMSRARAALAEAKTIQETKRIVDAAAAAEIYARRQKLGEEASDLALSIKVEALRKLGEMLADSPKATGVRMAGSDGLGGTKVEPPRNQGLTLADLGLTKKESAVAQKLAALPASEFQQVRDGHVTVAKAIAAVDAAKARKPSRAEAERQAVADEANDGFDPLAALEEAQREVETLTGHIKALEAEDSKAELRKALLQRDHAVRQQSEAMDSAVKARKREEWAVRQLQRCGKAIGESDPDKIAPAVEAFARQHRKVAA